MDVGIEDLDDQNEAALETMKNYSTQLFLDDDYSESDEEVTEAADYNSSWFDDSFGHDDSKTTTPEDPDANSSEDISSRVIIDQLNLKVNMLEKELVKCKEDNNYLEALLAVRDTDFARYLTLEKQQRMKAERLQDELEDLEEDYLDLQQKLEGDHFIKTEGRIIVTSLISDVLSSIGPEMERSSKQLEVDEAEVDTSEEDKSIYEEEMPTSPVAGPFKEQISILKRIQSTAGLCPAEEIKLKRLEEISQSEEYINLVPHSKSSLANINNTKKPLKKKLIDPEQTPKRSKRQASKEQDIVEKKAKMSTATTESEKKSKPIEKKKSASPPTSPSQWDGHSMKAGMRYSEAEVKKILGLKRVEKQIFMAADASRLVIFRNPALMAALTTQDDPQLVFSSWNLTSNSYQEVTGEPLEKDDEEDTTSTTKNKIGRDQPNDLLKISNSKSFYQLINTMFNKINQFSTELPEFSTFDWLEADVNQVDFVVKLFLEWLQPLKNSCSMGDRTTTGTNKTYKTGLQNVFKFVLKRKDIELSRQSSSMSLSMMAYRGKQAAYANSGQLVPEGSRERKPILDLDQELRDQWLTKPLKDIENPDNLTLTVAAIIADQACVRGVKVLEDVGRSAFRTNLFDEDGKEYVEVKQAISRKRDQGYANKPFRPFNKKFTGDHEVNAIKLLLSKLPPLGCQYCKIPEDLKKCVCDEWMLSSKSLETWQFSDQVWYARQQWSVWKVSQFNSTISRKAKLSRRYTNSSARPTGVTNLARAGFTSAEISAVSEHVDMNTLEKYKKLTHLTQAADRHKAGLILAPSGRQLLRGKDNQFGQVGSSEDSIYSEFQDAKLKKRSPVSTVKASPTDSNSDKQARTVRFEEPEPNFKKPNPKKVALQEVPTKATLDADNSNVLTKPKVESAPFIVNQKVFAKLRGFPYWPANVTRAGYDHVKAQFIFTVMFPNGQTGVTGGENIMKLSKENYEKLLNQKFKKSGYEVKSNKSCKFIFYH